MQKDISFKICKLDAITILNHLRTCDNLFQPKLSSKVDLVEYSKKISDNAIHFCSYKDDLLIGILSMYANNFKEKIAYMTCASILKEYQGKGIARKLFINAILYAKENKFDTIQGEVRKDNSILLFYKRLGFEIFQERNKTYLIELKTDKFLNGKY